MGAGILSGRVGIVHEYLMPWDGNPVVIAWWVLFTGISALFTLWVLTGGATTLSRYPALPVSSGGTETKIKWFAAGGLAFQLLVTSALFFGVPIARSDGIDGTMPLFVVLFPFAFAAMWIGISFSLATRGGWKELAVHYPAPASLVIPRFYTGGRVGDVAYSGCLGVGADHRGLALNVMLPFRLWHAPLWIPWDVIEVSTTKRFWTEYVVFDIQAGRRFRLEVMTKSLARHFRRHPCPPALAEALEPTTKP